MQSYIKKLDNRYTLAEYLRYVSNPDESHTWLLRISQQQLNAHTWRCKAQHNNTLVQYHTLRSWELFNTILDTISHTWNKDFSTQYNNAWWDGHEQYIIFKRKYITLLLAHYVNTSASLTNTYTAHAGCFPYLDTWHAQHQSPHFPHLTSHPRSLGCTVEGELSLDKDSCALACNRSITTRLAQDLLESTYSILPARVGVSGRVEFSAWCRCGEGRLLGREKESGPSPALIQAKASVVIGCAPLVLTCDWHAGRGHR